MAEQVSSSGRQTGKVGSDTTVMDFARELQLSATCREQAVTFAVDGQNLAGNLILTEKQPELGLLFLHGWGGVRSGPHNLLTALARAMGEKGCPSLRFDFRGRGESEGLAGEASLISMAEDSLAAAALLKTRANVGRLVMIGICSGGNVGIGILDRLPEVSGLFMLSVYPFGDGDSFARDARRSVHYLKGYWRKLWLKETWRKVFRGEIDYGTILKILLRPLRRSKSPKVEESKSRRPLDNLLLHQPPLLMIYGEADPDYLASRKYYEAFAHRHEYPMQIKTIPGANHNFYSLAWKQQIINELADFIKEQENSE